MNLKRIFIWLLFICNYAVAQKDTTAVKDTTIHIDTVIHKNVITNHRDTFFLAKKRGWLGMLGKSMSTDPPDENGVPTGTTKNVDPFMPFNNHVIRKIIIEEVGFEKAINDTNNIKKTTLTRIGDALHRRTRERIIRNNLFFSAGGIFSPYLVADNVQFLRTLNYLQDARIVVKEAPDSSGRVDVVVLYKDVFSISGAVEIPSANVLYLKGQEDNFMGTGDRLSVQNFYDMTRNPKDGYGAEYIRRNIKGSFVNWTLGFENINSSFSSGRREENYLYTRVELPLVSPYYLWTGAFEASSHITNNNYWKDSLYLSDYNYNYYTFDGWFGYNISGHHLLHETTQRKVKHFLALRGFEKKFTDIPNIYKTNYYYQYANVSAVLGSYTIFKQDYYRTNFLYGFGRNEDVPEGFNLALTGGWAVTNGESRPYTGASFQRSFFTKEKRYFNYTVLFGGYFGTKGFQDISSVISLESFTKLRHLGSSKWYLRHFINASISQQYNTYLNDPLRINSQYGIPQLNGDTSLKGTTRITAGCSSVYYNTWKFLDFRFAPFSFVNFSYIRYPASDNHTNNPGDLFTVVGCGVRTRNENLVFGTIELRLSYYPKTTTSMTPWNIAITTNLSFTYNSRYIQRPDFVNAN
ncbi:hypothetical protein ACI6Q2_19500 [Chitinophagaceae bacterium LWZ2-11]